jgi:cell division protein FtsB
MCRALAKIKAEQLTLSIQKAKADRECAMLMHKNNFLEKMNNDLQARLDAADKEQLQLRTDLESQV